MNLAQTEAELIENMKGCLQTKGMNMLQHGNSVHNWYYKIFTQATLNKDHGLDIPDVMEDIATEVLEEMDDTTLALYHIFHDCGKPLCRVVDDEGRQHFPNHAEWSYNQFLQVFPCEKTAAELIRMDMEFHTRRGEDLVVLWQHELAPILYITAWAEIYANAEMFGGIESDSFKIKKKRLCKAAKIYEKRKESLLST